MSDPELIRTAYQEAAHATMRFVLGRSTGIVSIRPSPGRLGLGDCLSDTRASARSQPIEARVLILLTGGSAGLPVTKVPCSRQRLALQ